MKQCAIVVAGLGVTAGSALADLVITEVMAQTTSGSPSTINGDWWELTNTGASAIDLTGYQWADTEDQLGGPTPQTNFFPAFTINAGESIIILEEDAINEAFWLTNWGAPGAVRILGTDEMLPSPGVTDTFSGLSSSGDAVFFYDAAGVLIDDYTFGVVTRGVSFESDIFNNDLGLSVVGENGAVRAANGDTGSPGVAVPAPAAGLVLVMAGLAQRRRHSAR